MGQSSWDPSKDIHFCFLLLSKGEKKDVNESLEGVSPKPTFKIVLLTSKVTWVLNKPTSNSFSSNVKGKQNTKSQIKWIRKKDISRIITRTMCLSKITIMGLGF